MDDARRVGAGGGGTRADCRGPRQTHWRPAVLWHTPGAGPHAEQALAMALKAAAETEAWWRTAGLTLSLT